MERSPSAGGEAAGGGRAREPADRVGDDSTVGAGANIGAGAITCNYDGFEKFRTDIGAGAFIGTNVSLVAPVTVGSGAYVGAGSTITKDVPADALAIARGQQVVKPTLAAEFRERRRGEVAKKRRQKDR